MSQNNLWKKILRDGIDIFKAYESASIEKHTPEHKRVCSPKECSILCGSKAISMGNYDKSTQLCQAYKTPVQ